MKKITSKISIVTLIFICIFSFSQCHKNSSPAPDNPYGLPNATQTGAGVFACLINGQKFIAKDDINHIGGVHNDTLGVEGTFLVGHYFDVISIGIYGNFKENSVYNFADAIHTYCLFGTDSTCQVIGGVTNVYPKNGGVILTKLDILNKIISGTFNFKVPIPNCDTLNVTDGRFDIRY